MYICIHSENNLSFYVLSQKKKSCPNCLLVCHCNWERTFFSNSTQNVYLFNEYTYEEQHVKLKCQIPHRLCKNIYVVKYISILCLRPWLERYIYISVFIIFFVKCF